MKKFLIYIKNNKLMCLILGFSLLSNICLANSDATDETQLINPEYVNELEDRITEMEKYQQTLEEKLKEAEPWFELKEEERKAEEERLAAEKEEAERKAREEAERKEKLGYDTGITYSQLARTPDDYEGEKCKFRGKVVQVMEGDRIYNIRLAVNGDYDNIIYILAETNVLDQRILEDDYITVYGTSTGIYTYESTLGASISIPSMLVDRVEL